VEKRLGWQQNVRGRRNVKPPPGLRPSAKHDFVLKLMLPNGLKSSGGHGLKPRNGLLRKRPKSLGLRPIARAPRLPGLRKKHGWRSNRPQFMLTKHVVLRKKPNAKRRSCART
jgi:hypothetical protein